MAQEPVAFRKGALRVLQYLLNNSRTGRKDYVTVIRTTSFQRDEILLLSEILDTDARDLEVMQENQFIPFPQEPVGMMKSVKEFLTGNAKKLQAAKRKALGLTFMGSEGSDVVRGWLSVNSGLTKNPSVGDYVFVLTKHEETEEAKAFHEAQEVLTRFRVIE